MVILNLSQVSKNYGNTPAIHELDLQLSAGELVTVLGPSGSGKTTLLRLIAGLDHADAGLIHCNAQDITSLPPHQRNIAMMFQQPALYPHLSVRENICFNLSQQRQQQHAEEQARLSKLIEWFELNTLLDRLPHQISGGEQQRVAIVRALIRRPQIFLLDEPLAHLDTRLRASLRGKIRELQRQLGITMLYVTHDPDEALELGDRVVVMHQGRVVQFGRPIDLVTHPEAITAELLEISRCNFREGSLQQDGDGITIRFNDPTITISANKEPALTEQFRRLLTSEDRAQLRIGMRLSTLRIARS